MVKVSKIELKCKICGKTIEGNYLSYKRELWRMLSHLRRHQSYFNSKGIEIKNWLKEFVEIIEKY